jgi:hypothetical protein
MNSFFASLRLCASALVRRDKIRQQLQNLARAGFLLHAGRNDWRLK